MKQSGFQLAKNHLLHLSHELNHALFNLDTSEKQYVEKDEPNIDSCIKF